MVPTVKKGEKEVVENYKSTTYIVYTSILASKEKSNITIALNKILNKDQYNGHNLHAELSD